jgi:hypothetical protein
MNGNDTKLIRILNKRVFQIEQSQFFALFECLNSIPISSTITATSDSTTILWINRNDVIHLFSKDEVVYLLSSPFNVQIPEQSEMVKKAVVECKAENMRSKAMREITSGVSKFYSRKNMSSFSNHSKINDSGAKSQQKKASITPFETSRNSDSNNAKIPRFKRIDRNQKLLKTPVPKKVFNNLDKSVHKISPAKLGLKKRTTLLNGDKYR